MKDLYEIYMKELLEKHSSELAVCKAAAATIRKFGEAMLPFPVRCVICEGHDGVRMYAYCLDDSNAGVVIDALMVAGYDVDEPRQVYKYKSSGKVVWSTSVHGHGLEFVLNFELNETGVAA